MSARYKDVAEAATRATHLRGRALASARRLRRVWPTRPLGCQRCGSRGSIPPGETSSSRLLARIPLRPHRPARVRAPVWTRALPTARDPHRSSQPPINLLHQGRCVALSGSSWAVGAWYYPGPRWRSRVILGPLVARWRGCAPGRRLTGDPCAPARPVETLSDLRGNLRV